MMVHPFSPARQTDVGSTRIWSAEQNCRWCVDNYKQIGRAIELQKGSKILSAFKVLKRQVDDSETLRQLAATGQDRGDGDRLPKACCGILKIILGRNARKKVAVTRNYFRCGEPRAAAGRICTGKI